MAQGTHAAPNQDLQAMCRAWEEEGRALTASLYVGFPHADIEGVALSAVVTTDGDEADAHRLARPLLDHAWAERERLVFRPEPLTDSVARDQPPGVTERDHPVVLPDHCVN